jgi:hypothetical protein
MRRVEGCPACGQADVRIAAAASADVLARFRAFSKIKYGGLLDNWLHDIELVILGCLACGHHWYRDQPEPVQLDAMYAAGRPLRGSTAAPAREPSPEMIHEMHRLRGLLLEDNASLLDYGSGFGRWARAAVQAGFAVSAFEPSQARASEHGVPFTLVHDIAALHGQTFDVVNLEQVLEHVSEPFALLQGLRSYCHAGSLVRIAVPNILRCDEGGAIWREWPFDGRIMHVMAPFEHLHGFTPRSLRQVVARAGFVPVAALRTLLRYPAATVRWKLGRWMPRLDQTFLIVRPLRA